VQPRPLRIRCSSSGRKGNCVRRKIQRRGIADQRRLSKFAI